MNRWHKAGAAVLVIALFFFVSLPALAGREGTVSYRSIHSALTRDQRFDPARFDYVKPALKFFYKGGDALPKGARIIIEAAGGNIVLYPDDANVIEWPMNSSLLKSNPDVSSVPRELNGKTIVRVVFKPAQRVTWATVEAMKREYSALIDHLGFLARLRSPTAERLKIVGAPHSRVTVSDGSTLLYEAVTDASGIAHVPLDLGGITSATVIEFANVPRRIQLDLGLE